MKYNMRFCWFGAVGQFKVHEFLVLFIIFLYVLIFFIVIIHKGILQKLQIITVHYNNSNSSPQDL